LQADRCWSIVDHNEIAGAATSLYYSAYQFGGGWPEVFNGVTSYCGGDAVTNNYVHGYCNILPDCGGICSNGNSTAFSVTGNYVKNYGNPGSIEFSVGQAA
jgi:hypothetical protein